MLSSSTRWTPWVLVCLLEYCCVYFMPSTFHTSYIHPQTSSSIYNMPCIKPDNGNIGTQDKGTACDPKRSQASGEDRAKNPNHSSCWESVRGRETPWRGLSATPELSFEGWTVELSQWRRYGVAGDDRYPDNERSMCKHTRAWDNTIHLRNHKCSGVNATLVLATIISHLDPCNTLPSSTSAPQSPHNSQSDLYADGPPTPSTQNALIAPICSEQNPEFLAMAFEVLVGVTPATSPTSLW